MIRPIPMLSLPRALAAASLVLFTDACTPRHPTVTRRALRSEVPHALVDASAERIEEVIVVQLLAIGWAETPSIAFEHRPGVAGAIVIPAGQRRFAAAITCWDGSPPHDPAVGDRYRLTLRPRPAPDSPGGPYALHVRAVDRGVTTYWDVTACTRLPPS